MSFAFRVGSKLNVHLKLHFLMMSCGFLSFNLVVYFSRGYNNITYYATIKVFKTSPACELVIYKRSCVEPNLARKNCINNNNMMD